MKKKYNRIIFLISLMFIISLSYNVHFVHKIKSEDTEKNILSSSYMKIHLLEFYQDIQDYSSFVDHNDVKMLLHLIDSMKEQRSYYIRISGHDLQVSQFLRRYIKILEEYRDSILFEQECATNIQIEDILMDIKIINNWFHKRGINNNFELYNLNELIDSIGEDLNLISTID